MSDCEDLEPLLAAYADGGADASDRLRVEEHLDGCPACRHDVAAQRRLRDLLRAGANELREAAPPGLRARIVPERSDRGASAPPGARWRAVPLSAAAAILIALTGLVAVGILAPQGRLLAAQLALDHVKCQKLAGEADPASPSEQAAAWERERGWAVTIPDPEPTWRLRFVALRRCLSGDGEMAHLVYRQGDRAVSLFVFRGAGHAAGELEIMGHEMLAWSTEARTYAVVSDLPHEEIAQIAAQLRSHLP